MRRRRHPFSPRHHSPDLTRRVTVVCWRVVPARWRASDGGEAAREGMYAAAGLLPTSTALHGQARVPGSNAPAAGCRIKPP
uniref:Uncharacterized protein n=1 Tax=Setaria italica TaxID=4555 RepID=K3ZYM9_SETIT